MDKIIAEARTQLLAEVEKLEEPRAIFKSKTLKSLYGGIKDAEDKKAYGQAVNELKKDIEARVAQLESSKTAAGIEPIDVTAPFAPNTAPADRPGGLPQGTQHPITKELDVIVDIFGRMGFNALESRQLDSEHFMFTTLNFPKDHPARDEYDTFITEEGLVAPAHTSVMQHRIIVENKHLLEQGLPISYVVPGRVFRNEDVDARHEHTFHQVEGVYVSKGVTVGNLIATLKTFLEEYYGQSLEVKTQPFYFPFTEPSFEFALSCPFCKKSGCKVCSQEGWIELLGCGMIHPNVLKMAGVDPEVYTGFAWGFGVERLVMMKYQVNDVRWFFSGDMRFLEQF